MGSLRRQFAVAALEARCLLSTVHGSATAHVQFIETDQVSFAPINGSGVTGSGVLRVAVSNEFGQDRAMLTLRVEGLSPGAAHALTLAGFDYLDGRQSTIPPGSAALADSTTSGLGSNILSESEGEPYYGSSLSSAIRSIPAIKKRDAPPFSTTFLVDYDLREPLSKEGFVIRGMPVNGQYQATVPVAFGTIATVSVRRS